MYTGIQIINPSALQRLFPNLQITPALGEKIKSLSFYGSEFIAGFKVKRGPIAKRLKEEGIDPKTPSKDFSGGDIVLTHAEAESRSSLFGF